MMKRTLEKLAQDRKDKEEAFSQKLEEVRRKAQEFIDTQSELKLNRFVRRLEEILAVLRETPPTKRRSAFTLSSKTSTDTAQREFNQQALFCFKELQGQVDLCAKHTQELSSDIAEIAQMNMALIDTKDKEWDALSNNHVAMIFKSLEWRVDKLDAQVKDVNMLMKSFFDLREKLTQLSAILEEKKMPTPTQVAEILQPLEDWRYTGFENRFRGREEEVQAQLEEYLPYFKKGRKVLDLGCGRGEFLDLLKSKWIESEGIDTNAQMVSICRDKGLPCQRGDILEKLAEHEDNSLGGIFSSQVIEHLPPPYLKRLLELAYVKLGTGGTIVLETINSTSVFALVQIYNLDMSHQQPIHPQALRYLLESSGFEDVTIKYTAPLEEEMLKTLPGADEQTALLNQNIDSLNKLLYAPSNYAAVGYKK